MRKKSRKRKKTRKMISLLVGGSILAIMAALAIGGTIAYFSDAETSTDNTLQAGSLDLKVGDTCSYNGQVLSECTWEETDLKGQLFFNYQDIKPGDFGENTLSLEIEDNPGWVCAAVNNVKNFENGCNDPEKKKDQTCDNPGKNQGELQDNLHLTIWRDYDCENDFDGDDYYIVKDARIPDQGGQWSIADSTTKNGPLPGKIKVCLGVAWKVPNAVSNVIQGDSLSGDIIFNAVQSKNNDSFQCATSSNENNETNGHEPIVKAVFEIDSAVLEEILDNTD